MTEEHFKDLGFAAGTVRGARAWRIWPKGNPCEGQLAGLYYKQTWVPGENLALCRRQLIPAHQMFPGGRSADLPMDDSAFEHPDRGHLGNCRCGFYAYYDGSNDYYRPDYHADKPPGELVAGMIEGYGEVLIGSRGFRCTRARIVALTVNPELPQADAVREWYVGIPVFHDFKTMEREFPNDDGGARSAPTQIEA